MTLDRHQTLKNKVENLKTHQNPGLPHSALQAAQSLVQKITAAAQLLHLCGHSALERALLRSRVLGVGATKC